MLKKLAVFSALVLWAGIVSSQPNNAADNKQRNSVKGDAPVVAQHSNDVTPHRTNDQSKASDNPPCGDASLKGTAAWWHDSNWWLVVIAGCTSIVIGWQAWETRRAAKGAQESANASYGSVTFAQAQWELMKEKERARLDIKDGKLTVEDSDKPFWHLKSTIFVRNIGRERAYLKSSPNAFIVKPAGDKTPELESSSSSPFPEIFLDPSESYIELAFSFYPEGEARVRHLAEDLHDSRRSIHLYGFIEYESMGVCFRKEYGYYWQPMVTAAGPLMGLRNLLGDEDIQRTDTEKIEYGFWTKDWGKENAEHPVSCEQPDGPN